MTCPGCGAVPPATSVPTETLGPLEARHGDDEWWDPAAWWCPSCLAARIIAAHDADCRCEGCLPAERNAAA